MFMGGRVGLGSFGEKVLSASANAWTLAEKANAAFPARNANPGDKDRTKANAFHEAAVSASEAYIELASVAHPSDTVGGGRFLTEVARRASSAYLQAAETVAAYDGAFIAVEDATAAVAIAETTAAQARAAYDSTVQAAESEYRSTKDEAESVRDTAVAGAQVARDKVVSDAEESFRAAIAPVEAAHNRIVTDAKTLHDKTVAEAGFARDKIIADAEESLRATIAPVEAAHNRIVTDAKVLRDETVAEARAIRDSAIAEAGVRQITTSGEVGKIETEAVDNAREELVSGWIKAYANPGPNSFRDVEGYASRLVFKLAVAERELCPSL